MPICAPLPAVIYLRRPFNCPLQDSRSAGFQPESEAIGERALKLKQLSSVLPELKAQVASSEPPTLALRIADASLLCDSFLKPEVASLLAARFAVSAYRMIDATAVCVW
eukprot:2762592-Pleurochrysis_carterae.AAC.1